VSEEVDVFTEVARRFFNEFLEMKVGLDKSGAVPRQQQEKEQKKYEKEIAKWEAANKVLRESAQDLMQSNEQLVDEVAQLEVQVADLRLKLNEQLMNQPEIHRRVRDFPLTEHMSERAYQEWCEIRKLMGLAPGDVRGR